MQFPFGFILQDLARRQAVLCKARQKCHSGLHGGIEPLRQRYILIQPYPSADIDEDLTLVAITSVALGVPFGS